ncbi:hypothetical protein J6590_102677 [Homalodisca vitripennis]|nr:hypothetical protein J6590_102677 [Homalodisca vitripennis]
MFEESTLMSIQTGCLLGQDSSLIIRPRSTTFNDNRIVSHDLLFVSHDLLLVSHDFGSAARDKADNCGSAARDKADNYVYS